MKNVTLISSQKESKMNELNNDKIFKMLADVSLNPIIISSVTGQYLYVNQAYLDIRQEKEENLLNRYWWETFRDKDTKNFAKNTFKLILQKRKHSYRYEYQDKKGQTNLINWSTTVVFFPPEKCDLVFEIGYDASAEVKLKSQIIHLQKIENLGTLASGIAHEFNNILTSIIGYTSFLKGLLKADSREIQYIAKIQKAALGAASLTSKILSFSRRSKSIEKFINVNSIVGEVYEIIKSTFSKNIQIKIELVDPMYSVLADYDQIYQSLMNLVLNSKDVMKEGGMLTIRTQIKVLNEEKHFEKFSVSPGRYVSIQVIDNGIGIPEENREKIFEPFFTTKMAGEGTGLGLSMVYSTIKGHHGYVFVDSEVGKGSTFELYLPAVSLIKELPDSDDSGFFPVSAYAKRKTILIAEDEEEIIGYLETVLQEYGYEVLKARNGQEALDIYKNSQGHLDMMLIDVMMPVMDGKKVVKEVKKADKDLKIIIMTSCADENMVADIKALGVNYLLFKPFKVSNLMKVLEQVYESKDLF